MSTQTSPNMGLLLPVVSSELGPAWATEIFSALFSTIDAHDHSPGKGVKVTPAGLNISSDLTFAGVNATNLRSVRLANQGSPLNLGPDIGCVYESAGELWYNDASSRQVKLTNAGAPNATTAMLERTPAISGTFSILSTDAFVLYYVDTSGGAVTVNLPASSAVAVGRSYYFVDIKRNASTNNITVVPNGTDKINTVNANFSISMNGSYTLFTNDGAGNWYANTTGGAFDGTFLGFQSGTQFLRLGKGGPNASHYSLWLGDTTGQGSAATDWCLSNQGGSALFINAPAGNVQMSVAGGAPVLQVNTDQTLLNAGQSVKQITQSTTYTVDSGATFKDYVILLTGNAFTTTLPTPSAGRVLKFKDAAGNAATQNKTIAPHAAETIDGAASYVLNVNKAMVTLISDGTNWFVLDSYAGTVL